MKKLFTLTLAIALVAGASSAQAELELSGNASVIVGYQHNNGDAGANNNAGGIDNTVVANAPQADQDIFGAWVDQIELDGDYVFAENVRVRFDLDFVDHTNGTAGLHTAIEQGYVTFNIPAGNGVEFAVGKFNAPVGLESIDRPNNVFVTYTPSWVYLVPKNVFGGKLYYSVNDNWNFDISIVNDFNGYNIHNSTNSVYPSGIVRIGGVWGDEDAQSSFNLAGGLGFEHSTATGQYAFGNTGVNDNDGLEIFGNLWGELVFNYFTIGYEGLIRGTSPVNNTNSSDIHWAFGGQLYGQYAMSDTLSVQGRYALHIETALDGDGASTTGGFWNGSYGAGFEGQTHTGSLGLTYNITDGADVTFEYRLDYNKNETAGVDNALYNGFFVGWGYQF